MPQTVTAIGTADDVGHHVQTLAAIRPVVCLEPEVAVQKLRPGDLAIFLSEHFERFRRCSAELKQRQVSTLYMIDGILEWRNAWENCPEEPACPWTMRPVLADKVACIGASQARTLAAWGNREKIEIVGVPRFDPLQKTKPHEPQADRFRILVATAKFPGFTPDQVAITLQSLRDLKKHFDRFNSVGDRQIEIVWRLAPQISDSLDVPNSASDLTGSELANQLRQVDAVITTPSTLMLESMLLQRPVALLDYHNCPQYVPAAWTIRAAEQIEHVLQELANPAGAKIELQQQILSDTLQLGEPATDRLNKLVDAMLRVAGESIARGTTPVFDNDMLPPPTSDVTQTSLNILYPHVAEFENLDTASLQTELAHARRELLHLESVIAGLRNELGQAHEIFDQIHRHPLAGPVVRARQKILDMIVKLRGSTPPAPANSLVETGGEPCRKD